MYGEKLIMKKHKTNADVELLFLSRQKYYLYHQLKILTDKQQQLLFLFCKESQNGVLFNREDCL